MKEIEKYKGLGRRPKFTKSIKTGWCGFCRQPRELKKAIPKIGYLCPICGGRLLANHPGISRNIYKV